MDIARLGLAVDSSQVEKGTVSLNQLTGAAGKASAAARGLGGASQVEATGQKAATAAVQAHNAALTAQNALIRSSMQQRTMMIYQLNDVAVSLASGMNPAMVAMQQGSQILQGGFMPAVRTLTDLVGGLVAKFWPLAAVVGIASAAIAGMTHEINETSAVTVGFGDVALATWQVIAGGIYEVIRPAVEMIGGWFGAAWNWVVQATKDAGNWIIRSVVGSIEYVKTSVASLPSAFIVAGEAAAQGFADAVTNGLNSVVDNFNGMIAGINQIAGSELIPLLDRLESPKIDIGGAKAMQDYSSAWKDYANTVDALADRDIMGEFFGAIQQQAIKNATARMEANEDAAAGASKAAKEHAKAMSEQEKAAKKLAQSLENTLGSALQSLFEGPLTSVEDAVSRILGSFAQLGNQNLNSLFDGMFGGGAANDNGPTGGQYGNGFWGSAIFEGAKAGTEAGAEAGWKDGLGSLGKMLGGQGGAMLSAGIGGLGMGYQSQNPLMGGLGGALQGFAAGGPVGAVIGGIAGFIGGIFGMNEALEKAKGKLEEIRPQIEKFVAAANGEVISKYASALADATAQAKQMIQAANNAHDWHTAWTIEQALEKLPQTLAKEFDKELSASINALSDLDYVNEAQAALDQYNQRLADAAKLGVDGSKALTELDLTLQQIVREGELTAAQVSDLAMRFPELAASLDLVGAAVNKIGAEGLYEMVQKANAMVGQARADLRSAYEAEANTLRDTISRHQQFLASLERFKADLRFDDGLSPLNPYDRMKEAEAQFQDIFAKAASGDEKAQGELVDVSRQYLEEARAYYANSESYFAIFGQVENLLGQVKSTAEEQVSEAQAQLNALTDQVSLLVDLNTGVMSVADAIAGLTAALELQTAANDKYGQNSGYSQQILDLYSSVLGRNPDAQGAEYWQSQISAGVMGNQLYRDFISGALAQGEMPLLSALRDYGIPGYANGTMFHPGGLAMVGERGPELLNLPRGAQVYPQAAIASMAANSNSSAEVVRELRSINARLASLEQTTAAGAQAQVGATSQVGTAFEKQAAELRSIAGARRR